MKFTFDREMMLSSFQPAAAVAPSRSPKPILQSVKLICTEGESVLMATDTEVGVRIGVEGINVEVPGSIVLPVDLFGQILRECTDKSLTVEMKDTEISVDGDTSSYKIPSQNPDEFPDVSSVDSDSYLEIPARLMSELIKRTFFATDSESSRYALGGLLLELNGNDLIAVGTDGRRLAKMQGPVEINGSVELGSSSTIVPTRSMTLILRAIVNPEATVKIMVNDNQIVFVSDKITLTSRLVEGRYPKWQDVFPSTAETKSIDIGSGEMLSKLKQAAIVANDDSRGINCTFCNGTLTMDAQAAERGQSHTEMPIAYEGEKISVTMDHRYVSDFLKALDSTSQFSIFIENAQAAVLFTTEDGYSYIIMPLATDR